MYSAAGSSAQPCDESYISGLAAADFIEVRKPPGQAVGAMAQAWAHPLGAVPAKRSCGTQRSRTSARHEWPRGSFAGNLPCTGLGEGPQGPRSADAAGAQREFSVTAGPSYAWNRTSRQPHSLSRFALPQPRPVQPQPPPQCKLEKLRLSWIGPVGLGPLAAGGSGSILRRWRSACPT